MIKVIYTEHRQNGRNYDSNAFIETEGWVVKSTINKAGVYTLFSFKTLPFFFLNTHHRTILISGKITTVHTRKKSYVGPTLLKRRVQEVPNYQTRKFKISTWSHSDSCLSFKIILPNIETLLLLSSPIESKKRFKVHTFLCLNWSQIHGIFYELTVCFLFFRSLNLMGWFVFDFSEMGLY